ncbi:uncharacterized protein A1O9_09081 [Exophiala aquamarina CBS 119918]|uniref:RWD domain-containing protein n=1 Tax=Exophiala aquamarina CBS 119918 TaxID=1182545 RepID=A0A072P3D2_9EURO|nr:uncharacterized protein A1O9_09081 [Exophiala aquamarina CBS 119918]KEF54639.1 hypothetical protein A1O9_09081 [Exophiala aquamarina CBS 119918]
MPSEKALVPSNASVADELEALNAIYEPHTLDFQGETSTEATVVLRLPDLPFSFSLSFPPEYPDVPPVVTGTQSTGISGKGEGEAAVSILRDLLGTLWTPGQVCLFDLVEEATPILQQHRAQNRHGAAEAHTSDAARRSATSTHDEPETFDLTMAAASTMPPPTWILSEPMTVSKSTFIARACQVSSLDEAQESISHLFSTNKKVATATHNIQAWRIQSTNSQTGNVTTIQDSDDDGETAAGGRLLHLMQLMDVWNVVVVVTRWYGGVKLGPDRFRLINMAAREALSKGGFVKEESERAKGKGKGKK